ncbi:MAG: isoprenyl transferase [Elusimicrobia bacterium]|nr:isoprenyl transferase [Elusimicrobiota bacterium]
MSHSADDLRNKIDPDRLPVHVAIIMDGNGRWAKKRHLPRLFGHRQGAKSVREIVETAGQVGVKVLTLYAFSTENWLRPKTEISGLMRLLKSTLRSELPNLNRNNVRLETIGGIDALPDDVRDELEKTRLALAANTGLRLVLALNYGGRQDIVQACNAAMGDGRHDLDEKTLANYLQTREIPDPDLLIRTSGEYRVSNFLLWQIAYAEIHITPVLWPDLRSQHFYEAVLDFQKRDRRFGAVA